MNSNETITKRTNEVSDEIIQVQRRIHQNPELGFEEVETSRLVSQELEKLGIPHRTGVGRTGVVGIIEGGATGKTLVIRADMDALPIQESEELPFASKVPGKMHACGHDAHTAILLGVANVLIGLRNRIKGRVKLIFQPNEEGLSGAQAMIDDGVFENPSIDMCLGFHNWPPMAVGKVGYHPDVCFSSSDAFDLTIKGVSGHGAHPHLAVDAVTSAAYFITQLQTIVSREIAPVRPAVVSIGHIQGGQMRNVLPDNVLLQGTVRTQSMEVKTHIEEAMRRLLDGIKVGMRVDYELDYQAGVPVLRNDKEILKKVLCAARSMLGADAIVELPESSMGSEDFALFTTRFPSAHLRIGSKVEGLDTMVHRSNYQCNEEFIPVAIRVISRAAMDLLH